MNNSVYGKTINLITTKNISHIKMGSWDGKEAKKLFQKPLFYNVLIEKWKIKCLKYMFKIHRFTPWTSFLWWLNIYKMPKAFGWYARSYKVEIMDSKDPLA